MFSLAVIVQIRSSENISNVTERVDHGKKSLRRGPEDAFSFCRPSWTASDPCFLGLCSLSEFLPT